MAGYSGTPLPKKLGIKDGHRVAVLDASADVAELLGPLPSGVTLTNDANDAAVYDIILLFTTSRVELHRRFAALAKKLQPAGGLWICWPKRASGVVTDVTENVVRDIGLAAGLVDNKVCAVDETWSGLRFVFRVHDRPKKK